MASAGECEDDHFRVVYVASHGPQVADLHGGLFPAPAATPHDVLVASDQGSAQARIFAAEWTPAGPSARKLRAQFQVFLI
jgi:hypothetical protein